jgi:hypothetical protein
MEVVAKTLISLYSHVSHIVEDKTPEQSEREYTCVKRLAVGRAVTSRFW